MDSVDEALAWFEARKSVIIQMSPMACIHEGIDNGGRAVQIDLDSENIVASATIWASGMCWFEAIVGENDAKVIDEAYKELDAPLGTLLDDFLDRLNALSK